MRMILILGWSGMFRVTSKILAAAVAVLVAVSAASCGGDDDTGAVEVVATTTVLGDLVRSVGGERVTVDVLIPLGADPHDYRPSSREVARVVAADLVVANGLGLEEGLDDTLQSAAEDGANVVWIAPALDPRAYATGELDPLRMADAAAVVAAALDGIDPSHDWGEAAAELAAELRSLHGEIVDVLAAIPADRRKLVTNHDAFGYFADRYGFEIVGVVIPGGSTLAEPSSAELAELVATIRREGVPAIFAETSEPTRLAEALAAEAGNVAVVELFSGSVGEPGSGERARGWRR